MEKPALVVSDLHLGAVPDTVQRAFVRFLRHWQGRAELLVINGDLFDFWCEVRTAVPSAYFHTLRALADLRESGVRLVHIGGNHDAWGGPFLRDQIGMELVEGPVELSVGGRRALVAHGDGVGPGDVGYKLLKRVLRSGAVTMAMRWIHPDLAWRIARRISRTSEPPEHMVERSQARARVLEAHGVKLLEERADLDLVIFGHCHIPCLRAVGDRGHYVNSGDWVVHRTYTVVTPGAIDQREWERAEGLGGPGSRSATGESGG